jgi:D-apionolactonase
MGAGGEALRAGPLSAVFDRGELRWIRLGSREVLRGIYVALRAPGWVTLPPRLSGLYLEAGSDRFRIRFTAVHRREGTHFEWQGSMDGEPDGTIRFAMDGVAHTRFLRNRIGLCVLHPIEECAGEPCIVEHVDGRNEPGAFPRLVAPHQPFLDVRAIRHQVGSGLEAEVRLEGDTFETEDQRNWSDASFKTYSTPLTLPFPVEVAPGTRIAQSVTLRLIGGRESHPEGELGSDGGAASAGAPPAVSVGAPEARSRVASDRTAAQDAVTIVVDPAASFPVPRLGLCLRPDAPPLTPLDAERLRALRLDHLRVDLRLAEAGWPEALVGAMAAAEAVGTSLEAALFLPDAPDGELNALAEVVREHPAAVSCWLVFRAADGLTTGPLVAAVRRLLTPATPAARLAGGTDGYFVELNRRRPSADGLDRVSFALCPQAHATDDATVLENLASLASMGESARALYGDERTLGLSRVTLRPRDDPEPDSRQSSFLGAAWTAGLIASAAAAGFSSLTLYETVGLGGVMDRESVFPVYDVLAEVAGASPGSLAAARSSRPHRVLALALRTRGRMRLLAFNLGRTRLDLRVVVGKDQARDLALEPDAIVRLDLDG